jgi:hypothetical protein
LRGKITPEKANFATLDRHGIKPQPIELQYSHRNFSKGSVV